MTRKIDWSVAASLSLVLYVISAIVSPFINNLLYVSSALLVITILTYIKTTRMMSSGFLKESNIYNLALMIPVAILLFVWAVFGSIIL